MYTRQHRIQKKPNHSDTPVNNQLLPGRFIYQQKLEDVKPQSTPTTDVQAKTDEEKSQNHGFIDGAIFSRQVTRPEPRGIQMKLAINEAGDNYEQEADQTAQTVVSQVNSPESEDIQREVAPEEEEPVQAKLMVQRRSTSGGKDATPDLEESIQQQRGNGQVLEENVRKPMEHAFGADFSQVKIHTDSQSDQINQSIQARAFTTGQDLFFRSGEYNPGSSSGKELLAHELTHVVQQNGDEVRK